jgi:hypothetical protein
MVSVTLEPAGISTRPLASLMSELTVVVTRSPALFTFELISASIAVASTVPVLTIFGAGAGAGAGAGFGAAGLGFGLGCGFGATATGCAAG